MNHRERQSVAPVARAFRDASSSKPAEAMQSPQVRRCCGPKAFWCLLRTKLCNQLVDTALEPLHLGRIAPTLSSLPPRLSRPAWSLVPLRRLRLLSRGRTTPRSCSSMRRPLG